MIETITISLDEGRGIMILNLENFFPCSIRDIKYLDKKCIQSDFWHNDRNKILNDLQVYLCARIVSTDEKKEIAKEKKEITALNKELDKLRKNFNTVLDLMRD